VNVYIVFELDHEASEGRKTKVWEVLAVRDRGRLGVVKWFPRWRQYTFFPAAETVYNHDCLHAIAGFVAAQTLNHRALKTRAGR
jgi:hypothetical protein